MTFDEVKEHWGSVAKAAKALFDKRLATYGNDDPAMNGMFISRAVSYMNLASLH